MSALAAPLAAALRRHWGTLLAAAALVYFAVHGMTGERGIAAWHRVHQELAVAQGELELLRAERERLERRGEGLEPDRIDPDLLEEELRKLGYVGEREAILVPGGPAGR